MLITLCIYAGFRFKLIQLGCSAANLCQFATSWWWVLYF